MADRLPFASRIPSRLALVRGLSPVDGLDPRGRILSAVAFSAVVAVANRMEVLGLSLLLAVVAAWASRLRPVAVLHRLLPLNAFMVLAAAVIPLSMPGTLAWHLGPLRFSQDGLMFAARLAVKGNAIVLGLIVFLGTMDLNTLGHALSHLHVPQKLIHLLLFTVRYIEVLEREYGRLVAAMKIRGFRPGMNLHTYRS